MPKNNKKKETKDVKDPQKLKVSSTLILMHDRNLATRLSWTKNMIKLSSFLAKQSKNCQPSKFSTLIVIINESSYIFFSE